MVNNSPHCQSALSTYKLLISFHIWGTILAFKQRVGHEYLEALLVDIHEVQYDL